MVCVEYPILSSDDVIYLLFLRTTQCSALRPYDASQLLSWISGDWDTHWFSGDIASTADWKKSFLSNEESLSDLRLYKEVQCVSSREGC